MSFTPKTHKHATRTELEARYLIAIMRRDAHIFAERAEARNTIMAREPVRRQNPQIEKPPRPSLSIFEDSFAVLR